MITQTKATEAAIPSSGQLAEERHASRAGTTYGAFLTRLRAKGFASDAEAERTAVAVLCALEQRLGSDQAFKLESQLPSILAELLAACPQHRLRPRNIGKREFFELVEQYLDGAGVDAETAARRVFEAVAAQVSAGETQKIIHQLPRELRELWPEWARAAEDQVLPVTSRPSSLPLERAPDLVDDVLALNLSAQLGVLRTIAPKILARLGAEERSGFLRDLDSEISLALSGVPTYDLRHGRDA